MTTKLLLHCTILALVTLTISACSSNFSSKTVTNKNYQTLCAPLVLKKNEQLTVKLPSSRFSGYKWQLENDAATILQLKNNQTQKDESPENLVHRQETIWQFTATHPGNATLSFIYQLDWDNNVQDNQRVQCQVSVLE